MVGKVSVSAIQKVVFSRGTTILHLAYPGLWGPRTPTVPGT